jgi:hypothetical protein
VVNNLAPANASAYDSWLAFQRSDAAEKFWLIKGNASDYNYSAHEFNGERSTASQLLLQANAQAANNVSPPPSPGFESVSQLEALREVFPTLITEVPRPLPPLLTVEVHTLNQMMRTDKLADEKPIIRTIDSRLTLAKLKTLITQDIITGIERAFRLYEDPSDGATTSNSRLDYSKVELSFQCFSPVAHAWRPVLSEVDWVQAKQSCRDEYNVLRVMYALEKKSEFLLLKEIQTSYKRQRDAERVRDAPQISLKALTESLEQDLRLRKKYVFNDSPPSSPKRGNSAHGSRAKRPHSPALLQAALTQSSGSLPAAVQLPGYFLPLGQNAATLAALSSTRNSAVSTPSAHGLSRSGRKPSRLLDSLTRTSSGSLLGGQSVSAQSMLNGSGSLSASQSGPLMSTQATAPPTAGAPSLGSKSIFYPKRSDTLDKMYEQLESSIPRQQDFANNLEQRLFKTKW